MQDPAGLARLLAGAGYFADDGVATAAYLALALPRPLYLEGEAGVGKTALAHALAQIVGVDLLRLQCYEGIDASQALYDWDFPRQLLHLRAAESTHSALDAQALESEVYSRRFLLARPLLAALETSPAVLLVDVSGSMESYADALLRFAHAASRTSRATEVFALGTRLTRISREMALRDPDAAMAAVAAVLADAGGGTRLGELLKQFLDQWGQRGTARGAVVVLLADGWERGEATLLGEQVARLHRLAHRVVWANPRKAAPGYAPLAAGMAAALPHVDDFVEGHSLAALEHLAEVVAGRRASPVGPRQAARA